eukprot:jgi/Botrbrau1/17769/Bobra.0127s0024.1
MGLRFPAESREGVRMSCLFRRHDKGCTHPFGSPALLKVSEPHSDHFSILLSVLHFSMMRRWPGIGVLHTIEAPLTQCTALNLMVRHVAALELRTSTRCVRVHCG